MNTDTGIRIPQAEDSKLLLKQETHDILNCAFEVLNELGHGWNEKIYENALTVEFRFRQVAFDQQRRFSVDYKGQYVGEFIPDLIAYSAVIVDTKVIEQITDRERGQMINYLRITKLRVGLILNFRYAKLQWERIVV